MGQNIARADSPHAARRRLLESHGRTEKFPSVSTVCVDPIWVGLARVGPVCRQRHTGRIDFGGSGRHVRVKLFQLSVTRRILRPPTFRRVVPTRVAHFS
jgi:hypothetical protein